MVLEYLIIICIISSAYGQWVSVTAFKARLPGLCRPGFFDCGLGICIPLRKVHDGIPDCFDLSDEFCFPGHYHCGKYCVDLAYTPQCLINPRCDGTSMAPRFCPHIKEKLCSVNGSIPCKGYGECILRKWADQGKISCIDRSDADREYISAFNFMADAPVSPSTELWHDTLTSTTTRSVAELPSTPIWPFGRSTLIIQETDTSSTTRSTQTLNSEQTIQSSNHIPYFSSSIIGSDGRENIDLTVTPTTIQTTLFNIIKNTDFTTTTIQISSTDMSTTNPSINATRLQELCKRKVLQEAQEQVPKPYCECELGKMVIGNGKCQEVNVGFIGVDVDSLCNGAGFHEGEESALLIYQLSKGLPYSMCVRKSGHPAIVNINCGDCHFGDIVKKHRYEPSDKIKLNIIDIRNTLCDDPALVDCDPYATCYVDGLSYRCVCPEGMNDTSAGTGRKCRATATASTCYEFLGLCAYVWLPLMLFLLLLILLLICLLWYWIKKCKKRRRLEDQTILFESNAESSVGSLETKTIRLATSDSKPTKQANYADVRIIPIEDGHRVIATLPNELAEAEKAADQNYIKNKQTSLGLLPPSNSADNKTERLFHSSSVPSSIAKQVTEAEVYHVPLAEMSTGSTSSEDSNPTMWSAFKSQGSQYVRGTPSKSRRSSSSSLYRLLKERDFRLSKTPTPLQRAKIEKSTDSDMARRGKSSEEKLARVFDRTRILLKATSVEKNIFSKEIYGLQKKTEDKGNNEENTDPQIKITLKATSVSTEKLGITNSEESTEQKFDQEKHEITKEMNQEAATADSDKASAHSITKNEEYKGAKIEENGKKENILQSNTQEAKKEKTPEVDEAIQNAVAFSEKRVVTDPKEVKSGIEGAEQNEKVESLESENMEQKTKVENITSVLNNHTDDSGANAVESNKLHQRTDEEDSLLASYQSARNSEDGKEEEKKELGEFKKPETRQITDETPESELNKDEIEEKKENYETAKTESESTTEAECSEIDFTIIALHPGIYPTAKGIPLNVPLEECIILKSPTEVKKSNVEAADDEKLLLQEVISTEVPIEMNISGDTKTPEEPSFNSGDDANKATTVSVTEEIVEENRLIKETVNKSPRKKGAKSFIKSRNYSSSRIPHIIIPRRENATKEIQQNEKAEMLIRDYLLQMNKVKKPMMRQMSDDNSVVIQNPGKETHVTISCPNTSRVDFSSLPKLFDSFKTKDKKSFQSVKEGKEENTHETIVFPKLLKHSPEENHISPSEKLVCKKGSPPKEPDEKNSIIEYEKDLDPDIDKADRNAQNFELTKQASSDSVKSQFSKPHQLPESLSSVREKHKESPHKSPDNRTSTYITLGEDKNKVSPLRSILSQRNISKTILNRSSSNVRTPFIKRKIENKRNQRSQTARTLRPTTDVAGRKWSLVSTLSTSEPPSPDIPPDLSLVLEKPGAFAIITKQPEVSLSSPSSKILGNYAHTALVHPVHTVKSHRGKSELRKIAFEEDSEIETVRERHSFERPKLVKEDLWWSK